MNLLRVETIAAVVFALLTAAVAPLQAQPAPGIPFEKFTLANGLEVILSEDHRLPLVAFNLWVHAGPRNEAAGQTGFAHLFEHLMFAGTRHIPRGQADQIIDAAGGTDSNGSTDFDRTNYFFTLPSNQLELGLWIKSDMLGYMTDKVDAVALANQQDVVRNERRQRTENQPYGIADEAVFHALYPAGHPYRARIIGSHADIQSIRLADVHAFARTYYRPNNATLVLAGDFDPGQARALVQRYFGSLQPGPKPPAVQAQTQAKAPPITRERRLVVKDRIELPRLTLAWHAPAAFAPGDAELDIAANVLGGGKASRLYRSLVYRRQIAQSVSVQQSAYALGSVFSVEVVARPGHTLDEIEAAVDAELALLAHQAPGAAEMARVRSAVQTRMFQQLERVGTRADTLNYYNQVAGDPGALGRDLARYDTATPDAVRAAVATHLRKAMRVNVQTLPGEPVLAPDVPVPAAESAAAPASAASGVPAADQAVALNADEPWRATQPQAGPARPLALPAGKRLQLANGLTVIHVPQPQLPLVSATLVLRTGQDRTPPQRPGLAGFASDMLQEGTRAAARRRSPAPWPTSAPASTPTLPPRTRGCASPACRPTCPRRWTCWPTSRCTRRSPLPRWRAAGRRAPTCWPPSATASAPPRRSPPAPRSMAAAIRWAPARWATRRRSVQPLRPSCARSGNAGRGPTRRRWWSAATSPRAICCGWRSGISAAGVHLPRQWTPPDKGAMPAASGTAVAAVSGTAVAGPAVSGTAAAGPAVSGGGTAPTAAVPAVPSQPALPQRTPTAARLVLVDKPGASQTALQLMAPGPSAGAPDAAAAEVVNAALGGLFTSRINQQLREVKGYSYGLRSAFALGRSATHWSLRGNVRGDVGGASLQEIFGQIDGLRTQPLAGDELQRVRNASLLSLPGEFDSNDAVATRLATAWSLGLPADHYARWPARLAAVDAAQAAAAAQAHVQPQSMTVIAVGDLKTLRPQLDALQLGPVEQRDADGRRLP